MVNFLRGKARALRQSAKLCFAIGLALVMTTLVNGVVIGYLCLVCAHFEANGVGSHLGLVFWIGSAVGTVTSATIVGFGIIRARIKSARGGAGIAMSLGGRRVDELETSPELQRLRNVTEEMAIAYSLPIPGLYVLEGQRGINAFAAGFTPESAVIGVTLGCIKHLSRDQLQGVVAHEFSHISNGDMRLNMRLNSFVDGLRCIASVAECLIEFGQEQLRHGSQHQKNDYSGYGMFAIILGCAMWPVGFAGSLCSALLVLAVSRHREYLADARAVEATRNPQGLAQALRRIAGLEGGSELRIRGVRSVAYMMFSQVCGRNSDWFSCHPPLAKRINALDPQWDHTPLFEDHEELGEYTGAFSESVEIIGGASFCVADKTVAGESPASRPASTVQDTATSECNHQDAELAGIDTGLVQIVVDPVAMSASIPLLLFVRHPRIEEVQSRLPDARLGELFETLRQLIEPLDDRSQAALLNHALRGLVRAAPETRSQLIAILVQLEKLVDKRDWSMQPWFWLVRHVASGSKTTTPKAKYGKLEQLIEPVLEVLSLASQIDGRDAMAEYRFQRGWAQIGLDDASSLPPEMLDWNDTLRGLEKLAQAAPRIQRDLFVALGCAFLGDGAFSRAEIGFLRVVRTMLGCDDVAIVPMCSAAGKRATVS